MIRRPFTFLSIIGGMALFILFPFFVTSSVQAAVVINELLPKTEPPAQEWVELYNTGPESVSLDRWKLQTTTGFVQTFIFNASTIIAPHGFLTFSGSQTGINFAINGDSVWLFDDKNTEVDNHSFPGILGYNTSMGRSTDGGGSWGICATTTYNTNNDCPASSPTLVPSPTNTPIPTRTPTSLPARIPTEALTTTPTQQTFGAFLPSPTEPLVLGAVDLTTPTPTTDQTMFTVHIDKILALQILAVAISWGAIAIVAYMRHKKRSL